ncbi:hypothetical protein VUJ49_11855 [Pseudomonas berkeleyensis]|uniref:DUF2946 domain-containing protein n=1 Tax=Pseudomonas berkeleyensis TaxID=2726956 RepID=A0A7G5DVB8_9PSED|nr:hypothetical protein [Pseudomonas berkeleyensis]QMV65693.1 hypothetical protein HS968_11810 [Pseudomonas berkeleyensis]WSO41177.1 hypothetical protein VUJ49_11855 [Pseudomonas berkeleyensis]
MLKRLRTALVCLLMLALPMQAMAAFGMQLCQQVHGSGALHAMPEHGAQSAVMMHGDDGKPGMHHPAKATSCSLCAFCVSAAVIDQSFAQTGQAHRAEPPQALNERLVSVVPDTPERPPRLSFS